MVFLFILWSLINILEPFVAFFGVIMDEKPLFLSISLDKLYVMSIFIFILWFLNISDQILAIFF